MDGYCNLNAHEDPPALLALEEILKNATDVYPMDQEMSQEKEVSLWNEVRSFFGANEDTLSYLTSSGPAAAYHVFLHTFMHYVRQSGKTQLMTIPQGGRWTVDAFKRLEEVGCVGRVLPVDSNGRLTPQILEEQIKPRSMLLSLPWADGLTGVVQPIEDLARICHEREILFHVDATYVLGKRDLHFANSAIDFLTWDGFLAGNPFRGGGLLAKAHTECPSCIPSEEMPRQTFMSMLLTLRKHLASIDHYSLEITRLRNRVEKQLTEVIPEIRFLFQDVERLPNVSVAVLPGVHQQTLLYHLHKMGIWASIGTKQFQPLPEHLLSLGFNPEQSYCALSFALPYHISIDYLDRAVECIAEAYTKSKTFTQSLV